MINKFQLNYKIKICRSMITYRCNDYDCERMLNFLRSNENSFEEKGFKFDFGSRDYDGGHIGAYAGVVNELTKEVGIVVRRGKSAIEFNKVLIEKFLEDVN